MFIAYLSAGDEESRKAYEDIASQFRDEFAFGVNTDDAARQAEGVEFPGLKCHRHLDGDVVTSKGSFDADAIRKFVIEASVRSPSYPGIWRKQTRQETDGE